METNFKFKVGNIVKLVVIGGQLVLDQTHIFVLLWLKGYLMAK